MVSRLAADLGNFQFKLFGKGKSVVAPHALMILSQSEFGDAKSYNRDVLPEGYFAARCLDDSTNPDWGYYAIGLAAERLSNEQRPFIQYSGPAKYRKDFLGVSLAGLTARIWSHPEPISLVISYPPGHVSHRDELANSTGTYWEVEIEDRIVQMEFAYVSTAAEATGGLMNLILTDDGKSYKEQRFADGAPLVVDLGGGTFDVSAMYTDGLPNPSLQRSINSGVNEVFGRLETSLIRNNPTLFPGVTQLPRERVRDAFVTGVYKVAGHRIECQKEISDAKLPLLTELRVIKERHMRTVNSDYLVMTGAGVVAFQRDIAEVLNFHEDAVFLSAEPKDIHMANAHGLYKFLLMMEAAGYIKYE